MKNANEVIDRIYQEYFSKNWKPDLPKEKIITIRGSFYDGMWELIKTLNEHPDLKDRIEEELKIRRDIARILS